MSRALLAHPEKALEVLAREELGLNPDDLGSPWRAALTAVALFGVGLGLSLFTGRDALRSALRMVLIGGGAGTFSFLVGRALGVAIS